MIWPLVPLFFIIAVIYSAAGLGGGSAYIAVMVLFALPSGMIPQTALILNLIVASFSFIRYRQSDFFRPNLFWKLALTSIPAAYLGGRLNFSEKIFTIILAAALGLAALRLLFWKTADEEEKPVHSLSGTQLTLVCLSLGVVLGLLAGITGIGGGIYLIPSLIFLRMASVKEAAAVASLFIVVNSVGGLAGQMSKGAVDFQFLWPMVLVVGLGGFLGSKLGAGRLKTTTLQKIVGLILLAAAVRLMI